MPPKIKCAVYSYIKREKWNLSEDDDKAMMTVPPGKKRATTTDNGLKVELLKCTPLENIKEKDGKLEQRFRYLACVAVGDSNGSIGIGEKIATSRKLESKSQRGSNEKLLPHRKRAFWIRGGKMRQSVYYNQPNGCRFWLYRIYFSSETSQPFWND